jgi:hypothetical protein
VGALLRAQPERRRHPAGAALASRGAQPVDWLPADRRFDLLRDVDVLCAPHHPSLETRLSLRTRFLDAFAAGLPVVATAGGTVARLVAEHGAGWVVPPGDTAALANALRAALGDGAAERSARGRELASEFAWERVLTPLVAFCREPWRDDTRDRFAFRPATVAPPDAFSFRLRRKLRRAFSASGS